MSEKKDVTEQVRFFNVSLINAVPMSLPKFPQPQRLMGELVHSIEAAGPTFAWVQFLFRRVNLSPTLVALKDAMHVTAEQIKTPKRSWIDDSESDRPELYRDWYRRSGERIKRIDAVANVPHVLFAIQGMWVGDPRQLSTLPFKDCYDELDRLGTFVYRNPWMLVELVERRMVEDVSPYIMSYSRSRLESPSFLLTQEEIPTTSTSRLPRPKVSWRPSGNRLHTLPMSNPEDWKEVRKKGARILRRKKHLGRWSSGWRRSPR